jgi:hypothetical protein
LKKLQLNYNDQIIGYLDEQILNTNGKVEFAKFILFDTNYLNEIIENIKKSEYLTIADNTNTKDIHKNDLYKFEVNKDVLIIKLS